MPSPRSHDMPYFSGWPNDPLADFLHEYDGLASNLSLTSTQKVETILRYIPSDLRDFWQTLDSYRDFWQTLNSYNTKDWAKSLLRSHPGRVYKARTTSCFTFGTFSRLVIPSISHYIC